MASTIDSYSESNYSADYYYGNSDSLSGQSFTGNGYTLDSVALYMKKNGSPIGNLTASIYSHSGTFGVNGVPTGLPLATSDAIDASTLSTSYGLVSYSFTGANRITLENGTKYFLIYTSDSADGTYNYPNYIYVGFDNTSPSHAGNRTYKVGTGTWQYQTTVDICFYVYGDPPVGPMVGAKYPLPAYNLTT